MLPILAGQNGNPGLYRAARNPENRAAVLAHPDPVLRPEVKALLGKTTER